MKENRMPSNLAPAASPQSITDDFESSIIQFCRFAYGNGLDPSIQSTIDSVRAARIVDVGEMSSLRCALRTVLCHSKKEWDIFDPLFESFWYGHRLDKPKRSVLEVFGSMDKGCDQRAYFFSGDHKSKESQPIVRERKTVAGATPIERLSKIDFSQLTGEDLAQLEQLSDRLLRWMSFRLSRRARVVHSRSRIDLLRTIRTAAARGTELIELRYKGRKTQASRLVILLDVSDSMNPYSHFLFRFAYALGKHFDRLACFVFSTRLVDVTSALKTTTLPEALKALSAITTFWSGGTKIGSALREFNWGYGRRMRASDTTVFILSDGWDTDAPDTLVTELTTLKQRAKKLIWLNPLLGLDQYEPVTRSMSAALPFVDLFAPAHNLQSLLDLERRLRTD
jgi:uncharacterized protein